MTGDRVDAVLMTIVGALVSSRLLWRPQVGDKALAAPLSWATKAQRIAMLLIGGFSFLLGRQVVAGRCWWLPGAPERPCAARRQPNVQARWTIRIVVGLVAGVCFLSVGAVCVLRTGSKSKSSRSTTGIT